MSRFGELINELAALNEQDLKNSAQVYGAAASLSARLQNLLDNLKQTPKSLTGKKITKAEIFRTFRYCRS